MCHGLQPDFKIFSVSIFPCYGLGFCYWSQQCGQTQEWLTDRGTSTCVSRNYPPQLKLWLGLSDWPAVLLERQVGLCQPFLAALWRFFCKSRLRFLPLYTVTVIRCAVSPTATFLGLFPRGRATTAGVVASTSEAPGCVSAVMLCVAEALAALTLQRAFWGHVRLHRHS